MAEIITVDDLPNAARSAELVDLMVAAANAAAARVASCLVATDPAPSADQLAEAKLVLIGAVTRWTEAGAGAFTTQTAGPFSVSTDTRQRTGYRLWPSEITELQEICKGETDPQGAFSIDTAPPLSITGVTVGFYDALNPYYYPYEY